MRDGLTLLFVRHGETDWNAERRYQGQVDIPFEREGPRPVLAATGDALRAFIERVDRPLESLDLVASPLIRARETMEIILAEAATGKAPPAYRLDPRLKELSIRLMGRQAPG